MYNMHILIEIGRRLFIVFGFETKVSKKDWRFFIGDHRFTVQDLYSNPSPESGQGISTREY